MYVKLLPVKFFALGISATAAHDPRTTSGPSATIQERQIEFSSVQFTHCSISSGLAVPQPTEAVCGLAAAPVISGTSALIKTYTDVNSTASYIACSEICLATSDCTQVLFSSGSECSLYSGQRLYAKATSNLLYYDIACFECYQSPLTSSASSTESPTPSPARPSTTPLEHPTTVTTLSPARPSTTPLKKSTTVTTASTTSDVSSAWTSEQTEPMSYNMALTTGVAGFAPPPECSGSFTQVGSYYWQNVIVPAPHTTLTSCYPEQFYSSAVGALNDVSLPPFNPLVCPSSWGQIPYNSTYAACCPDGFGGFAPNLSNIQRPLSGVVCASLMISGMFVDVTSYDSAGSIAISPWTAGSTDGLLLATGFDGIVGVAASTGTTTLLPTSTRTSTPTSVSTGHAARLRWFAR